MARFEVIAEEVVLYKAFVEADDEREARRIANSGEVDWGYPVDNEFFRVVEVRGGN